MKRLMIGAAIAAAISAATPALAYQGNPMADINTRQANIEQRIEMGQRRGDLTPGEYRRLRHELNEVRRAERSYVADGWLTQHEVNDLYARIGHLSRDVYFQRHDNQQAYGNYNYRHSGHRWY
jgi:hypothetical protein